MAVNIGSYYKLGESGEAIEKAEGYESIGQFLTQSIIPNVLVAANLILFFMIAVSGFLVITGAGNPDKQKQAGQTLTWSVMGFLIVFGAYWILQILGVITGVDILNININN